MDDFIVSDDGYLVVYADGACLSNGRGGAKAGIGVWFRGGSPLNLSLPVIGRATNNNAEIQAITAAANQARQLGYDYLRIFTDSEFSINCTKWIQGWKENGWIRSNGQEVVNKQELLEMDDALAQYARVEFVHVRGHTGNYGNDQADKLARAGCNQYQG